MPLSNHTLPMAPHLTRRKLILGAAACVLAPHAAAARKQRLYQTTHDPAPGLISRGLWLRRPETDEQQRVWYYHDGSLLRDGYDAICRLMRDLHTGTVAPVDFRLLSLLSAIQTELWRGGVQRPLVINSGFRSHERNRHIEGSSVHSYHTQGRAADIKIDGLSAYHLRQVALRFNAGGVGLYPSRNFVHVDTGQVRQWVG